MFSNLITKCVNPRQKIKKLDSVHEQLKFVRPTHPSFLWLFRFYLLL